MCSSDLVSSFGIASSSELFAVLADAESPNFPYVSAAVDAVLTNIHTVDPSAPQDTAALTAAHTDLVQAEAQLAGFRQQIDNGWDDYNSGRRKYNRGKAEYNEAVKELEAAKEELEKAKIELDDAKAELDDARAELDDARAELDDARTELDDARCV